MIKKDTVIYYAKTREDAMFLAGIYDNYVRAINTSQAVYSGFMSERKQAMISDAFSSERNINVSFFGGFENAERKIAVFSENPDVEIFPIKILSITVKGKNKLSHRDFLGAVMSLGIKRDIIGDIIPGDETLVFVKEEMAEYIASNLTKAAKNSLSVKLYEGEFAPEVSEGEDSFETVASLRLDAVVSCGFNMARDKSKKLIESGRVAINGREAISFDSKISEGDVISARGFGRFKIKEIKGLSKKGRIILNINK